MTHKGGGETDINTTDNADQTHRPIDALHSNSAIASAVKALAERGGSQYHTRCFHLTMAALVVK